MDSRAAADFLTAWRRSLTTSWALDETLSRTTRAGLHVTFVVRRVQRPPDWARFGGGSVDVRRGDQLEACATVSGKVQCRHSGAGMSFAQTVDAELAALATYVGGRQPLYAVVVRAECYELTLRFPGYPVPPYGREAEFCFDSRSGAPAGSTVRRIEAVDITVVERTRAPATEADLSVPSDAQIERGAVAS